MAAVAMATAGPSGGHGPEAAAAPVVLTDIRGFFVLYFFACVCIWHVVFVEQQALSTLGGNGVARRWQLPGLLSLRVSSWLHN